MPYYKFIMQGGTPCDLLAGRPREVHILYFCHPHGNNEVTSTNIIIIGRSYTAATLKHNNNKATLKYTRCKQYASERNTTNNLIISLDIINLELKHLRLLGLSGFSYPIIT